MILFADISLLEPGDTVIPHIQYDARVNFNVMSGYGVWRQPCDGSQATGLYILSTFLDAVASLVLAPASN